VKPPEYLFLCLSHCFPTTLPSFSTMFCVFFSSEYSSLSSFFCFSENQSFCPLTDNFSKNESVPPHPTIALRELPGKRPGCEVSAQAAFTLSSFADLKSGPFTLSDPPRLNVGVTVPSDVSSLSTGATKTGGLRSPLARHGIGRQFFIWAFFLFQDVSSYLPDVIRTGLRPQSSNFHTLLFCSSNVPLLQDRMASILSPFLPAPLVSSGLSSFRLVPLPSNIRLDWRLSLLGR